MFIYAFTYHRHIFLNAGHELVLLMPIVKLCGEKNALIMTS